MDLRGYEQAKFQLSGIIQAVAAAKAVESQRSLQLLSLVGRRNAKVAGAQGVAWSPMIRCCAVEHNQQDEA